MDSKRCLTKRPLRGDEINGDASGPLGTRQAGDDVNTVEAALQIDQPPGAFACCKKLLPMVYSEKMQRACLTDVRRVALLNCIFSFLSVLVPAGRVIASVNMLATSHPNWLVWVILVTIAVALVEVLSLTFFWALYRDPQRIVISPPLRFIALGAAVVLLVIGFRSFGNGVLGTRADWSFVTQWEWRTGARFLRGWLENPVALQEFANSTAIAAGVSYVFLLIALFRQSSASWRSGIPASRFLTVVTKIGVVVAGLIVAILLIRVFTTPYLYSLSRQTFAQVGRNPPPFFDLLEDTIRDLLVGACYFTGPFVVHMSIRRAVRESRLAPSRNPL